MDFKQRKKDKYGKNADCCNFAKIGASQGNLSFENYFFLFLNQNICCGYSKEPSQRDGSFEHPKHMFVLLGKKIVTILRSQILLNVFCVSSL